ncbi:MAG: VOC family protein [Proteobacteria bacterium]|nr:VOC family protein [Pseudomonadota bacterium]
MKTRHEGVCRPIHTLLLTVGVLAWLGCSPPLAAAQTAAKSAPATAVQAVDSLAVTVSDMDRAVAFYTAVLSFQIIHDVEIKGSAYERLFGVFGAHIRVVRLQLGQEFVDLMQFLAPRGRLMPVTRSNDRWFQHMAIIVSDMDAAYQHLRANNVAHASTAPQTIPAWNKAAGGIRAFYFRDPDGHFLEILWFPSGKGDERWHRKDALFLGIDHTAIVVDDTEASLALYRDALGMRVVGGSENYGPEQERLNNVFGARLRITTLKANSGPAVEFLEYLSPGDGRPMPVDTRSNDIWHWHIQIRTADPMQSEAATRARRAPWISPGTVEVAGEKLGFTRGLMVRDPDGHAVLITN